MHTSMTTTTIVALLSELLEEHMAACDEAECPHIVSEINETSDCIEEISSCASGFTLTLADGRVFHVDVSEG